MQIFWLFYISCFPFSSCLYIFHHSSAYFEKRIFFGHPSSCHAASLELGWEAPALSIFLNSVLFCVFFLSGSLLIQLVDLLLKPGMLTHTSSGCFQYYISLLEHFLRFKPPQVVLVTLRCGAVRKEISLEGMRDFRRRSLISFVLKSFQLRRK